MSATNTSAVSGSRLPSVQHGTSLVSASMAAQVHTSPAMRLSAIPSVTSICLLIDAKLVHSNIDGILAIGGEVRLTRLCPLGVVVDVNRRAFEIVRALTGETPENPRSTAARTGGKRGGPARARILSPER